MKKTNNKEQSALVQKYKIKQGASLCLISLLIIIVTSLVNKKLKINEIKIMKEN